MLIPIALIISMECKRTSETERTLEKAERNAVFEQLSSIADSAKQEKMALESESTDTVNILTGFSSDDVESWPEHEEFYSFMHARPFWITDADTLGVTHPVDMEIHAYFDVAPFIVPSSIAGTSERGAIGYVVDWMPEGEDHCMPDGSISVMWQLLPLDSADKSRNYIPGQGFRFDPTAEWDTSFNTKFKGQKARVFCQHKHNIYKGVDWGLSYVTDVFFARKGYVYCIAAGCEAQAQFLGPESEWWRWVESHWRWMDEPHPDWSRYPIHRDSIKYKGRFHELPPEELEAEES